MRTRDGRAAHSWRVRVLTAVVATACLALAVPAGAGAGRWPPHPSPAPTVPLDVTVTPGPGQLVVSWSPPAYTGEFVNRHGQDIPYVLTDYDVKGAPAKNWAACPDLALTCTATGLRPGHTYKIAVRVWNAKGRHSPYTVPVLATVPS